MQLAGMTQYTIRYEIIRNRFHNLHFSNYEMHVSSVVKQDDRNLTGMFSQKPMAES